MAENCDNNQEPNTNNSGNQTPPWSGEGKPDYIKPENNMPERVSQKENTYTDQPQHSKKRIRTLGSFKNPERKEDVNIYQQNRNIRKENKTVEQPPEHIKKQGKEVTEVYDPITKKTTVIPDRANRQTKERNVVEIETRKNPKDSSEINTASERPKKYSEENYDVEKTRKNEDDVFTDQERKNKEDYNIEDPERDNQKVEESFSTLYVSTSKTEEEIRDSNQRSKKSEESISYQVETSEKSEVEPNFQNSEKSPKEDVETKERVPESSPKEEVNQDVTTSSKLEKDEQDYDIRAQANSFKIGNEKNINDAAPGKQKSEEEIDEPQNLKTKTEEEIAEPRPSRKSEQEIDNLPDVEGKSDVEINPQGGAEKSEVEVNEASSGQGKAVDKDVSDEAENLLNGKNQEAIVDYDLENVIVNFDPPQDGEIVEHGYDVKTDFRNKDQADTEASLAERPDRATVESQNINYETIPKSTIYKTPGARPADPYGDNSFGGLNADIKVSGSSVQALDFESTIDLADFVQVNKNYDFTALYSTDPTKYDASRAKAVSYNDYIKEPQPYSTDLNKEKTSIDSNDQQLQNNSNFEYDIAAGEFKQRLSTGKSPINNNVAGTFKRTDEIEEYQKDVYSSIDKNLEISTNYLIENFEYYNQNEAENYFNNYINQARDKKYQGDATEKDFRPLITSLEDGVVQINEFVESINNESRPIHQYNLNFNYTNKTYEAIKKYDAKEEKIVDFENYKKDFEEFSHNLADKDVIVGSVSGTLQRNRNFDYTQSEERSIAKPGGFDNSQIAATEINTEVTDWSSEVYSSINVKSEELSNYNVQNYNYGEIEAFSYDDTSLNNGNKLSISGAIIGVNSSTSSIDPLSYTADSLLNFDYYPEENFLSEDRIYKHEADEYTKTKSGSYMVSSFNVDEDYVVNVEQDLALPEAQSTSVSFNGIEYSGLSNIRIYDSLLNDVNKDVFEQDDFQVSVIDTNIVIADNDISSYTQQFLQNIDYNNLDYDTPRKSSSISTVSADSFGYIGAGQTDFTPASSSIGYNESTFNEERIEELTESEIENQLVERGFSQQEIDTFKANGTYNERVAAAGINPQQIRDNIIRTGLRAQENTNFSYSSPAVPTLGDVAIKNSAIPSRSAEANNVDLELGDLDFGPIADFFSLRNTYGQNDYRFNLDESQIEASKDIRYQEGELARTLYTTTLNLIKSHPEAAKTLNSATSITSDLLSFTGDIRGLIGSMADDDIVTIDNDLTNNIRRIATAEFPGVAGSFFVNKEVEGNQGGPIYESFNSNIERFSAAGQTISVAMNQPIYWLTQKMRDLEDVAAGNLLPQDFGIADNTKLLIQRGELPQFKKISGSGGLFSTYDYSGINNAAGQYFENFNEYRRNVNNVILNNLGNFDATRSRLNSQLQDSENTLQEDLRNITNAERRAEDLDPDEDYEGPFYDWRRSRAEKRAERRNSGILSRIEVLNGVTNDVKDGSYVSWLPPAEYYKEHTYSIQYSRNQNVPNIDASWRKFQNTQRFFDVDNLSERSANYQQQGNYPLTFGDVVVNKDVITTERYLGTYYSSYYNNENREFSNIASRKLSAQAFTYRSLLFPGKLEDNFNTDWVDDDQEIELFTNVKVGDSYYKPFIERTEVGVNIKYGSPLGDFDELEEQELSEQNHPEREVRSASGWNNLRQMRDDYLKFAQGRDAALERFRRSNEQNDTQNVFMFGSQGLNEDDKNNLFNIQTLEDFEQISRSISRLISLNPSFYNNFHFNTMSGPAPSYVNYLTGEEYNENDPVDPHFTELSASLYDENERSLFRRTDNARGKDYAIRSIQETSGNFFWLGDYSTNKVIDEENRNVDLLNFQNESLRSTILNSNNHAISHLILYDTTISGDNIEGGTNERLAFTDPLDANEENYRNSYRRNSSLEQIRLASSISVGDTSIELKNLVGSITESERTSQYTLNNRFVYANDQAYAPYGGETDPEEERGGDDTGGGTQLETAYKAAYEDFDFREKSGLNKENSVVIVNGFGINYESEIVMPERQRKTRILPQYHYDGHQYEQAEDGSDIHTLKSGWRYFDAGASEGGADEFRTEYDDQLLNDKYHPNPENGYELAQTFRGRKRAGRNSMFTDLNIKIKKTFYREETEREDQYEIGFIRVMKDPTVGIQRDNIIFYIPFQFNPELTGETRSSNWTSVTALGKTHEHLVWTSTNSRTVQFKTSLAVLNMTNEQLESEKFQKMYRILSSNMQNNPVLDWAKHWDEYEILNYVNKYRSLVLPGATDPGSDLPLSPPVLSINFGNYLKTRYINDENIMSAVADSLWVATDINIDSNQEAGFTYDLNPRMFEITMTLKEVLPSWRSYQTMNTSSEISLVRTAW